jgi:hypothetical protein
VWQERPPPLCCRSGSHLATAAPICSRLRAPPRKMGFEGIVSKHKGSAYRSGRSPDWLKMKNPACAAVKREAEEDWGKEKWR